MNYAAVLFDMDGLLIDSERGLMDAWLRAAGEHGFALAPADYLAVVGLAAAASDAILERACGGRAGFERARTAVEFFMNGSGVVFPLKRGAANLLAAFAAKGIPCAVASSSTRAEIEERLASVGVASSTSAPSPAATKWRAASRVRTSTCSRRSGSVWRRKRALAFEDSHNGARAALAAGASLAIVPDLIRPTAELAECSVCVLDSLDAAVAHVEGWFPSRCAAST